MVVGCEKFSVAEVLSGKGSMPSAERLKPSTLILLTPKIHFLIFRVNPYSLRPLPMSRK